MNPMLLQLAVELTPEVFAWFKTAFGKKNPTQPEPTDADVIAAFNVAFVSSLAKDDQWLAAHPE